MPECHIGNLIKNLINQLANNIVWLKHFMSQSLSDS